MKKEVILISFVVLFILTIIGFATITSEENKTDKRYLKEDGVEQVNIKHLKGNENANVVLTEYSDLQCPACGAYYPLVKQIVEDFGDKISFEYRHFPLRSIHANAEAAAIATEAAGLQGKFWEMHDILFERQKEWSGKRGKDIFNVYAKEIGLDVLKFENDMKFNEIIKNKVNSDYKSGIDLGVGGTPTFFLNGEKVQNPRSYEEFRSVIQQFILSQ